MLSQMRKHLKSRKAQSTLEYAILIAVVVGALIALNLYMRRAVSGKLRESADDVGTQYDIETGGYVQRTRLQAEDPEVTHSMMNVVGQGTEEDRGNYVIIPGTDWRSAARVGEGSEAQWTEESAVRELDEQSTTDVAAQLPD